MAVPKWKEQKIKVGPDGIPQDLSDYQVIEHRIGNQTNADANANKFFSAEVWKCQKGWYVYTNYGRVSEDEYTGAAGVYGPGTESEARAFFESKFKSKVRPSKGYKEIEFVTAKVGSPAARQKKNTIDDAEVPDSKRQQIDESKKKSRPIKTVKLHHDISRLVEQWYSDNTHSITSNAAVTITSDGLETPLGVLTFGQINKGRSILSEIAEAIADKDDNEVRKLTGAFYSEIPAKLGRKIGDSDLISSDEVVQQKAELLTQMEDALEIGGASFLSGTEQKYLDLGANVDRLSKRDDEWKRIEDYITSTIGHNHAHWAKKIKVKNVLATCLNADSSRYDSCGTDNETELFHGSRNGNILGLLSRGLLIAPKEAPCTGYLFDKGIYLADKSSKSIQYSSARFGGPGNKSNNCFLFIVKAKLGKQLKMYSTGYDAATQCKRKGCDSVWGVEGHYLLHNEFITYTLEQTKITHIVEIQL